MRHTLYSAIPFQTGPTNTPQILYIKVSTLDHEYCPTHLFHEGISSADKKQNGIFY